MKPRCVVWEKVRQALFQLSFVMPCHVWFKMTFFDKRQHSTAKK